MSNKLGNNLSKPVNRKLCYIRVKKLLALKLYLIIKGKELEIMSSATANLNKQAFTFIYPVIPIRFIIRGQVNIYVK